ncbi:hypothetical protein ACFL4R_00820 [Nitrospirota bacterium]
MKRIFVVVLAIVLAMSFVACKKESEAPISQQGSQGLPQGHPEGGDAPISAPQERQLVVPDDVKGMWKGIALNIEDKESSKVTVENVALGAEYMIPGTEITIKADAFLPDFIMEGPVITSRSAELNNPAAKIIVTEGGEEIFSSWIYANHPAIHPFMHEKYGITLKEGTK